MCSHSMSIPSDFEYALKSKLYVGQASPFGQAWSLLVNNLTSCGGQRSVNTKVHSWWDNESTLERMNDTATNYESEKRTNSRTQIIHSKGVERMKRK